MKIKTINGKKLVSGRDVHTYMNVKYQFSKWIKRKIKSLCLESTKDYFARTVGQKTEYEITVEAALRMVEMHEVSKNIKLTQLKDTLLAEIYEKESPVEIIKRYLEISRYLGLDLEKAKIEAIKEVERKRNENYSGLIPLINSIESNKEYVEFSKMLKMLEHELSHSISTMTNWKEFNSFLEAKCPKCVKQEGKSTYLHYHNVRNAYIYYKTYESPLWDMGGIIAANAFQANKTIKNGIHLPELTKHEFYVFLYSLDLVTYSPNNNIWLPCGQLAIRISKHIPAYNKQGEKIYKCDHYLWNRLFCQNLLLNFYDSEMMKRYKDSLKEAGIDYKNVESW